LVGDIVEISPTDNGEAVVTAVHSRRNQLVRPPIANIDGIFVVMSLKEPRGSRELLDKRLLLAGLQNLQAEIIFSKVDILSDTAELQALTALYQQIGYRVWTLSTQTRNGLDAFESAPRSGVWVLTGESGSGKSSLVHALVPQLHAASAGALSRMGRGKQTTRWVRLVPVASFWLADTPGFTSLSARVPDVSRLKELFYEWHDAQCRYADCTHQKEPGCAVKKGVEEGRYDAVRYQQYLRLIDEWVRKSWK
ncbi:MAG: ribosome small subunit-dependent GTPase A, partial [Firmicutes bacterium]|nr:ribosome small subunit-dependent GTPase A [Bacillota bacterium]